MFLSETFVYDCLIKDNCTTDTSIWASSTASFDRTSGQYMQITGSGSSNSITITKNGSADIFDYTSSYAWEFDCINANASSMYVVSGGDRKGGIAIPTATEFITIRIEYDASTQKIKLYKNEVQEGNAVTLTAFSSNFRFNLVDWQGDMDLKIKNFKAYPI